METTTLEILNNFIEHYKILVRQAVDCGSRDLQESIELNRLYGCKVIAIECNPDTIPICRNNLKENITLVEKAINSYKGICNFYKINPYKTITPHKDGNLGASSLFVAKEGYPHETYVQDCVTVECDTLNNILIDNKISKVDLLWIDLQGAGLIALKSLGNYLKDIEIIQIEIETNEMYIGQSLYPEINQYLNENNFIKIHGNENCGWFDNFIYINKKYIL